MSSAEKSFSLQRPFLKRLDKASRAMLAPDSGPAIDFTRPAGEPALAAASSISWRIFKNPVSLFIGGVAAVILELAEPRVRTGVWEHSGFRKDPVKRLRRTGLAAMITVYGAQSDAKAMIDGVRKMHDRVRGRTPSGTEYRASDPALLNWVHLTASYGFLSAYDAFVAPLSAGDRDRYYHEGGRAAALYGVTGTACCEREVLMNFEAMRDQLEPSPIIFEFLDIMRSAPVFPQLLRPAQPLFVRAAVSLTPPWIRDILGLGDKHSLGKWERALVKRAGSLADRIVLESSPAVQASLRLGLPANFLYSRSRR